MVMEVQYKGRWEGRGGGNGRSRVRWMDGRGGKERGREGKRGEERGEVREGEGKDG